MSPISTTRLGNDLNQGRPLFTRVTRGKYPIRERFPFFSLTLESTSLDAIDATGSESALHQGDTALAFGQARLNKKHYADNTS